MPWPAKPPMTLKEAKRAHKKDGGFRFTASQMARADRLEAREERRKKELDKARTRQENKRKREEKLERERSVKQKMLEEGRIRVEDTWGKVTASQPRLNKFFGQMSALTPSKLRAQESLFSEDERGETPVPQEPSHGEKDKAKAGLTWSPKTAQDDKLPGVPEPMKTPSSLTKSATSPVLPQLSHQVIHSSQAPAKGLRRAIQPRQGQPLSLRELNPSQINSRSVQPQRCLSKMQIESIEHSRASGSLTPEFPSPTARAIAAPHKWQSKDASFFLNSENGWESTATGETLAVADTGPTKTRDRYNEQPPLRQELSAEDGNRGSSAPKRPETSRFDADSEEDFTDGIDDETFLMLCTTQKPVQLQNMLELKAVRSATSTRENSPSTASDDTVECPSPDPRPECNLRTSINPEALPPPPESALPATKPLSESFSSIFNEIEDKDLIALAEKIESDMASPTPALIARPVTPTTRAQDLKAPMLKPPPPQPKLSMPPPLLPPPPKPKHLQAQKPKKRRTLPWGRGDSKPQPQTLNPWDDFGAPGASTQAIMLELVEKAEQEFGKVR